MFSPAGGRAWVRDLSRMGRMLWPERWPYAWGLLSLLVVNLADVLGPLFIAVAVDLVAGRLSARGPGTPHLLALLHVQTRDFSLPLAIGLYLALQLVSNVLRYPMLMQTSIPSHRIGQRLRNEYVDHLLRLSRPFYDRARSGDLMSLGTADIQAVRMFFGPGILLLFDTVMLLVFVLAVMFTLSWSLTVAALLPLPLIALFTQQFSHFEFRRFKAVQEDVARLTERARETYAGIRIIQGYAREDFYRRLFQEHSLGHFGLNLKLARVRALFDPSLDLLLGISTVLVLVFGGGQIARGRISVGTFVAFLFLVGNLSGPMVGFGWAVSLLQRGRASLQRLDELLKTPVEIADAPGAVDARGPGHLRVRGLTFAYAPDAPPALEDIDLDLPPGRTLGIIGPVGSGKTTLVSLLVRLYEPPRGTVFVDGVDVRDLTVASLRRTIVIGPQDTFLFSDTVARNIALAPSAAAKDPWELARRAAIADEIAELPAGMDTLLGERGVNLSGGQRQRIAIARAVGAEPEVLVLDDCLSAVDARTEAAILEQLDVVFAGRGGIVISHRVRAVARCDEIIVLAGGRVVARGSHEELLARPGYYADIAREQTRESAAVEEDAP